MRPRLAGAIGISGGPGLLIADEPTTSLDVTIQAQYLSLLRELQRAQGLALIFITHNLGIVARMCDNVAVMYGGRVVGAGAGGRPFRPPPPPPPPPPPQALSQTRGPKRAAPPPPGPPPGPPR